MVKHSRDYNNLDDIQPKVGYVFKGRLQSKYKFVLKAAFLYADIPTKTNFSEKFMF